MSFRQQFRDLRAFRATKAGLPRPTRLLAGAALLATLGFGGCAQQPQQFAAAPHHGKEYFPSSVYGPASRRVIAEGQPVPRGGGQYLVGKPYVVAGHTYYPSERRIVQVGNASWYGDAFHGRLTANGEIYDRDSFTAAHPTMPLPSYARVTNLRNNYSMIVRVNDRGPYASNRIMDVSRRVAEALDYKRYGTTKLKVEYVGRASLAGSDDAKLFATLRNGAPAQWEPAPTMVATAEPSARVASLAPYAPAPRREWREPTEPRAEDDRPRERRPALAEHAPARAVVAARTRVAAVEPPRRETRPRMAVDEERHPSRQAHVEEKPGRFAGAAHRHGPQEAARDAEAKQFALLALRPSVPHGARRDMGAEHAAGGRSSRTSRIAMVAPVPPTASEASLHARCSGRRHDLQVARARDD